MIPAVELFVTGHELETLTPSPACSRTIPNWGFNPLLDTRVSGWVLFLSNRVGGLYRVAADIKLTKLRCEVQRRWLSELQMNFSLQVIWKQPWFSIWLAWNHLYVTQKIKVVLTQMQNSWWGHSVDIGWASDCAHGRWVPSFVLFSLPLSVLRLSPSDAKCLFKEAVFQREG